jgi:hypothetical protein
VGQTNEERVYALDLVLLTQRKISTANFLDIVHSYQASISTVYIIQGNTVFMAGSIHGAIQNSITIGTQQIDFLGVGDFSNYLAKFNLLTDFTSRSSESSNNKIQPEDNLFMATLYPNPASNEIRVVIDEKINLKESVYSVSIFDNMTNGVLKMDHYKSGSNLNISGLRPGVYYIEIMNDKGEKLGKTFSKL